MAMRMMTLKEIKRGISPFFSQAWQERKIRKAMKIKVKRYLDMVQR